MLPFAVRFRPGVPTYEQLLFAVKKAVVAGQLLPGDAFPSVRALSQDLRINPNTAHKVVSALIRDGLLQVKPGIGTVVARAPSATPEQRRQLLEHEAERLAVEAKTLGLSMEEVLQSVRRQWQRLKMGTS